MSLLIVNGLVVNDDALFKADVLVEDGKITAVSENYLRDGIEHVIDATGRYVIPGGIDSQSHFRMPYKDKVSVDDFYHGTRAALAGSTTMIIDTTLALNGGSPLEAYRQWRRWADPKVCCDYGHSVAITSWNDVAPGEIMELTRPGFGVNSFKFYFSFDHVMVRDKVFYAGAKYCARMVF